MLVPPLAITDDELDLLISKAIKTIRDAKNNVL
jgi:adenosylmethionine-8-amino-7-oxononanoate aminotransferase